MELKLPNAILTAEDGTVIELEADTFEPVSDLDPSPRYWKLGEKGEKIPIKRSEYKKAMHDTFTVTRPLIPMCGHKLVHGEEPRHRNCESCWFSFFQVHGELSQAADEVFSKFGENGLRQLRGPKFAKNFLKFMSTLAAWKAATEAQKEKDAGS